MKITVIKKMVAEGKSTRVMALEMNCSQATIKYWLKKYGLKTKRLQFNKENSKEHKCNVCGEDDPLKFYGHAKSICKKCDNLRCVAIFQNNRKKIRDYLGGKCIKCSFDKYETALDVHHLDMSAKDPQFKTSKGWKWERIIKELAKCVLLCRNCHAAVHNGELTL